MGKKSQTLSTITNTATIYGGDFQVNGHCTWNNSNKHEKVKLKYRLAYEILVNTVQLCKNILKNTRKNTLSLECGEFV